MRALASIFAVFAFMVGTHTAFAAQPTDWGLWYQPSGSEAMDQLDWFSAYTFWFITPITLFVLFLLLYVMIRFRKSANPTPSKTTHNTLVEVVWTVVPIIILIAIAIPSFQLLDDQLAPEEEPTMTVKAIGVQWAWTYEYQDDSEISFDSYMLKEDAREEAGKTDLAEYPRLLAVDNELVVPVDEMIRVLVTSDVDGVLHAWAMPAFGVKMDAVPGRLNETWFKAREEGLYYGQCSELCGKDHAFMPIAIRVVSKEQFEVWKSAAADDVEAANEALMASIEAERNTELAQSQQTE